MLLRLAWRNLWRSPRRTWLTAAAGVFAVVLSLVSLAMATGSHERWIDQVVRMYPGHVELSLLGYRDNRTLDYGMVLPESRHLELDALPGIEGWAPRLETWALAIPDRDDSTGRAAWLVGISPERERALSRLGGGVRQGRFVQPGEELEVVLGAGLAENLGVAPGDQVILLSGDYYGSQSADRFRVVGLLSVGDDRFDRYAALVPLAALQRFLVFPDGISHVAFFASASDRAEEIGAELEKLFSPGRHEILTWPDLVPDIVQFVVLDDIGNYLTLSIIIVVVAFGLLNTVLMSVFERVREFGVMRAVGARPRLVFWLVLVESALISTIGIAIGLAIGIPLVLWLAQHPIPMPGGQEASDVLALFDIEPVLIFRLTMSQVVSLVAILLVVSMLAALPPAVRAGRGRPVDALRDA